MFVLLREAALQALIPLKLYSTIKSSSTTFVNSRSSQTTIDLTWANVAGTKFLKSGLSSSSNHGSDHQAISLTLNFDSNIQINERLTCNLEKIDVERYQIKLRHQIQKLNHINPTTTDDIDLLIQKITIAIQNLVNKQKKLVNHNKGKIKPWWDGAILDPTLPALTGRTRLLERCSNSRVRPVVGRTLSDRSESQLVGQICPTGPGWSCATGLRN
ncbi:hypothetical protein PCASD_09115 [Puccinia coronata f. sp. avenae]|uniref:Endonuclease/exonuclease/phosphatase domain-containing protein n=1 Tax=Puccinia coronata f. sp. avenae TaxID=200324 RepID=A0A2N5V4I8_9BASI|nr:hypothetical protein PCASD_09115 [Puccinia coronata f. sp. avenae]